MKLGKRILLAVGCAALLLVSWVVAITAKSDTQRQAELIGQAQAYLEDEVYIRCVPVLEEAVGYDGKHTEQAEELLKQVYTHLFDQSGYRSKYTNLLERQMARKDPKPEVFREAAEYYLAISKESTALSVLRDGIAKTGSQELVDLYEANRYLFKLERSTYQNVTATVGNTIQVQLDGAWGLADATGDLLIPCEYDKISTCWNGRTIVSKDGLITAVDQNNNRLAKLHEEAEDFGNYAQDRVSLKLEDGWHRASGEFAVGSAAFEEIGMYSDGYAPAKSGGKWGVVDLDNEWLIPPEYDQIIQDELGRCYAQQAVFVRQGEQVLLMVDGQPVGEAYQDARPFADGYAAVKKDGKWGFIDTQGAVQIDFQFDDALSFGQHLAAVKTGDFWGYVSLSGELVIEPLFLQAKSFSQGSAPVRTADGWQFITLLEYEKGLSL